MAFWIAIEGTDGVGKSTLAREIAISLRNSETKKQCILLDEFSDSPIGKAIKRIIVEKNFFMLGETSHYPISETLALCSDYVFQIEKIMKRVDKNDYLISDRGILSFLVYQGLRLRSLYKDDFDWDDWINNIFAPLPKPDLSICLTSPEYQIRRRLVERGDTVTKDSLNSIIRFQAQFIRMMRNLDAQHNILIENTDGNLNRVLDYALRKISKLSNEVL